MVAFTKGQGAGSDFLLIADPDATREFTAAQVAALCDRRFGVGADGLIRAVPTAALDDAAAMLRDEPEAQWFMDSRHPDGSLAEAGADALRVFAHFLVRSGLAEIPPGSTLPIATRAGIRDVTGGAGGYQVDLGRWSLSGADPLARVCGETVARPGLGIRVGGDHVVVALASLEELAALDLRQSPDVHPSLPGPAAMQFIVPSEPLVRDGIGHVTMRGYRPVCGETLSPGEGAAAAALAVRHWAGRAAPDTWRVDVPGGTLGVRIFPTEEGEHVGLSGPAQLVFRGEIDLAAPGGRG